MSEYVRKYASEEALRQAEATAVSSSSESSMSDFSEDEAQVKTKTLKELTSNVVLYAQVIKNSKWCWDFCAALFPHLSPTPN